MRTSRSLLVLAAMLNPEAAKAAIEQEKKPLTGKEKRAQERRA